MEMLPLALALSACLSARADVVYLKNGNRLEGVITETTRAQVTLDFGYGSTIIDKADIKKIKRSDREQASKTAQKLKRRQYEAGLAVPKGGEKLDELYRDAQSKREKALEARAGARDLDEEAGRLKASFPALKSAYASASANLGQADAGSDARAYNRRIGEFNGAGARIQAAEMRLGEIDRLKNEAGAVAHEYIESHRRLADHVRGEGAPLLKQETDYYAWLRDELAMMAGDFRQDAVPVENGEGGVYVNARLNGKVTARLLVDTGASTTFLYQEALAKLGLPPEARVGTARVKVADGRVVDAEVLRLDSISVGKSEVRNILATGSPTAGQGFDGLLGMTFLGRFIARVDATHGLLILEDLK